MPALSRPRKAVISPTRTAVALLVAALLASACRNQADPNTKAGHAGAGAPSGAYDIVITNGHIIDGTGNAWFAGDVGIRGDRIAKIAPAGMIRDRIPRTRASLATT